MPVLLLKSSPKMFLCNPREYILCFVSNLPISSSHIRASASVFCTKPGLGGIDVSAGMGAAKSDVSDGIRDGKVDGGFSVTADGVRKLFSCQSWCSIWRSKRRYS